jgi:hypothetical protein
LLAYVKGLISTSLNLLAYVKGLISTSLKLLAYVKGLISTSLRSASMHNPQLRIFFVTAYLPF